MPLSEMTDVTAMTKMLQTQPFDRMTQARKSAVKKGCSVEEILDLWECKRLAGLRLHKYIDDVLNGRNAENLLTPQRRHFDSFWAEYGHRYTVVETEVKISSEMLKLKGRYDCRLLDERDGKHIIVDWKPGYSTWGFAPLKHPFGRLWDSKHTMTSLQLSAYRLITDMQMEHNPIRDCYIVTIDEKKYKVVRASDYRRRLMDWLLS